MTTAKTANNDERLSIGAQSAEKTDPLTLQWSVGRRPGRCLRAALRSAIFGADGICDSSAVRDVNLSLPRQPYDTHRNPSRWKNYDGGTLVASALAASLLLIGVAGTQEAPDSERWYPTASCALRPERSAPHTAPGRHFPQEGACHAQMGSLPQRAVRGSVAALSPHRPLLDCAAKDERSQMGSLADDVQNAPGGKGRSRSLQRVHDAGSRRAHPSQRVFTVTGYCRCKTCCGPQAQGITASGKPVSANGGLFVAADRSIPFGTLLSIPGYAGARPVPVLDRGGAIKGNRIDLYFPTHSAALKWGKRQVKCTVYTAG